MMKAYNMKKFFKAAAEYHMKSRFDATKEEKREADAAFKPERDKVQAILDSVQSKARVRIVAAIMVYDALMDVENRLDISKKALEGVSVSIDVNDQNFPKAYKYKPLSTWFNAEYHNGAWYLTDVYRDETARLNRGKIVRLTDAAKEAITERFTCF